METYDDINETIRLTTIRIQEEYPELIKYITEIPEKYSPSNQRLINNTDLKEYLNSLIELIVSYAKEHDIKK